MVVKSPCYDGAKGASEAVAQFFSPRPHRLKAGTTWGGAKRTASTSGKEAPRHEGTRVHVRPGSVRAACPRSSRNEGLTPCACAEKGNATDLRLRPEELEGLQRRSAAGGVDGCEVTKAGPRVKSEVHMHAGEERDALSGVRWVEEDGFPNAMIRLAFERERAQPGGRGSRFRDTRGHQRR